jgi:sugar phosphate isomerase/epimerase
MEITLATTIQDNEITPSLIKEVQSHGFTGLEIDLNGGNLFSNFHPDINLRFHCRQYDLSLGEKSIFNYYQKNIEKIAEVGGSYFTLHYGFETNELSKEGINLLKNLVEMGKKFGVTVAVENLKKGVTSKPQKLLSLLEETGASLTIDLGHLKSSPLGQNKEVAQKILANFLHYAGEAHIYEREESGHVPPKNIYELYSFLEILLNSPCNFWVIELPLKDAIRTKVIIEKAFSKFFTI